MDPHLTVWSNLPTPSWRGACSCTSISPSWPNRKASGGMPVSLAQPARGSAAKNHAQARRERTHPPSTSRGGEHSCVAVRPRAAYRSWIIVRDSTGSWSSSLFHRRFYPRHQGTFVFYLDARPRYCPISVRKRWITVEASVSSAGLERATLSDPRNAEAGAQLPAPSWQQDMSAVPPWSTSTSGRPRRLGRVSLVTLVASYFRLPDERRAQRCRGPGTHHPHFTWLETTSVQQPQRHHQT